jgi:hypothetical protein
VTRRTKLWIPVGLLVLVVGAVMVRRSAKPVVEANFVRYGDDGAAVLSFTNRGQKPVRLCPAGLWYFPDSASDQDHQSLWPFIVVVPQGGTQVVARLLPGSQPPLRGETFSVVCWPQPSQLRSRLEFFQSKVGVDITSPRFIATVDLPPRPTPSPSP